MGKRSLRWSGGGLLALLSIGLHGVLLAWPMPESSPEAPESLPESLTEITAPAATVGVLRLPAAVKPAETVAVAPAPPPSQSPPPKAPPVVRSVPPVSPPPAPLPTPVEPAEATPPAPPTEVANLEPVPPEPLPATLDDRLRDPEQYQFNALAKSLTSNEQSFYFNELSNWLDEASQGLSSDEIPELGGKLAPIRVTYPITTCLVPPPAEGVVVVVVGPTGELVEDPELLDSTGYTVLDEKALELALQQRFEPQTDPRPNPRAHWLPVQVQYDGANCSS
ncbi:energy transducer TonB [Phormidium tenue]|uniref:energy transducer TonB n=1 Tax=Phormidium tenue TaxID=126344 RepID=UPI001C0C506C|nr:energy transducer TonB [Phormidium tenue]